MSQSDYGANPNPGSSAPARSALWPRVAYCIGFGIVAYALLWLVFALTILQLIVTAIAGERNAQLADFGARLGHYLRDIVAYLLGGSDRLPFPFEPFPKL